MVNRPSCEPRRNRVALIVDELRRGKVSGSAELGRVDGGGDTPFDRFGHDDLFDARGAVATPDLGTKGEQIVTIGHQGRAIHRCETCDGIHGTRERILPVALMPTIHRLAHELGELRERRGYRIRNRADDGFPPLLGVCRYDEQRAARLVRAHGNRNLDEHVDRVRP